jgi:2-hydroxychromene-2-carboxylate isomerase
MGDLIILAERIADRSRPSRGPAAFFFSLGCPISYLAAERVERTFGQIEWVPVPGRLTVGRSESDRQAWEHELLALAEREAGGLRLPLVAPDRLPLEAREASRAALFAAEQGVGSAFGLAASRLVFCGGYDVDDPEVIVEAAAAAGLSIAATVEAACDARYDETLEMTVKGLCQRGVSSTPAIRIGTHWFEGLDAVPGGSSFAAARASFGRPVDLSDLG